MGELFLLATIAGRRAAIRSAEVQSVVEIEAIAPVPRAPDHVAGIAALRSRALTVIDARRALGIAAEAADTDGRAVVCEVAGHPYALRVDRVDDVVEATFETPRPDASLGAAWDRIASALVETPIGPAVVIDVAALVAGPLATRHPPEAA
jgi:purine-binding chemotaxis protein CheW